MSARRALTSALRALKPLPLRPLPTRSARGEGERLSGALSRKAPRERKSARARSAGVAGAFRSERRAGSRQAARCPVPPLRLLLPDGSASSRALARARRSAVRIGGPSSRNVLLVRSAETLRDLTPPRRTQSLARQSVRETAHEL